MGGFEIGFWAGGFEIWLEPLELWFELFELWFEIFEFLELEAFDSGGLGPLYVFCLPIFDTPSLIDKERIEEELDDIEDTDLADDVERIVDGAARIYMKDSKK